MHLYPYQQTGADFLAQRHRALLADLMGLGKTIQAIEAAKQINALATTVVCPASAVPNWRHEWQVWNGPGRLHVISYSSLIRRDWQEWGPDLCILDESHYAKNPAAKRTKAALGLAQKSTYAWLLTGTPMPNDPTELWPMFKHLWPEKLEALDIGNQYQWMYRFCHTRQTDYGPKPYAVRNGEQLRAVLSGLMLRRTLDDVGLDLPPLRVDLFRLPKKATDTEHLEEYADLEAADHYTSTLRRVLGEAKAGAVAEQLISELLEGGMDKCVVLYYHKSVRDRMRDLFLAAGLSVTGFGGETPQDKREEAIKAFQTDPKFRVFLAQQTSAGTAITLTAANEIVLVEPSWSPEDNRQAIARIHRIGQETPCRARMFAVSGTLDEAVLSTIANKVRMQEAVGLTVTGGV